MKQTILPVAIALFTFSAHAQDVIVKKDGTPILSKVVEVNSDNVKYKKHGKPNGPLYSVLISDILSLTYENGDKEEFANSSVSAKEEQNPISETIKQGLLELPADTRNQEIINLYSTIYKPTDKIKPSKAEASRCFLFCGIKSNSIMSNDELEMTFEAKDVFDYSTGALTCRRYQIKLQNKTDKTIYIDKANCFRRSSVSPSFTYYEPTEQTTVTQGSSNGASVNMGAVAGAVGIGGAVGQLASGINVAGASHNAVSTTYQPQRYIAIAPHGTRFLSEEKYIKTQGGIREKFTAVERIERFLFATLQPNQIGIQKGMLKCGEIKTFSENELPWERNYVITYSTREDFANYSQLKCDLYIKEAIGSNGPKNTTTKLGRYLFGEEAIFYSTPKGITYSSRPKCYDYISSLDSYGIVGLTMFDAKETDQGTIVGSSR